MEQAPSYSVPFKFFIMGLIFAIGAGILFLFIDLDMSSRGLEITAILHLVTLGFFAMVMIGALFQMLPVVAGVVFERATLFSNTVFIFLLLGILTLVLGLFVQEFKLFLWTKIFFTLSLYLFSVVTIYKLTRVKFQTPTTIATILALISFISAITFGFLLLYLFEGGNFFISNLKEIHAHSAFFGWVFLLILGISYQVIPMFWVTTPYPKWFQNYSAYLLFALLIFFAFGVLNKTFFIIGLTTILLCFDIVTLLRFHQRKRKLPDISMNFWKVGIVSLIIASLLLLFSLFSSSDLEAIIGFLFGYFALSVIVAMLYKIVPFLTWFHLSSKGIFDIPTMKEMIPKKFDKAHFVLHILLFFIGIISMVIGSTIVLKIFALIFIISKVLMLYSLIMVSRYYYTNNK